MPRYPWLFENTLNTATTASKIHAMRKMGVPYAEKLEATGNEILLKQAEGIAENLKKDKIEIGADKEIIALIAYLQRLGKDTRTSQTK